MMEIYVNQSLKCVWKNLREDNLRLYDTYGDGSYLTLDNPYCTIEQLNQGYAIEIVFFVVLLICASGINFRRSHKEGKTPENFEYAATPIFSMLFGVLITTFVNFAIIFAFPVFLLITFFSISIFSMWTIVHMKSPLSMWKDYKDAKEQKAQNTLEAMKKEIEKLRSSDPVLHRSLQSLDSITTALID